MHLSSQTDAKPEVYEAIIMSGYKMHYKLYIAT